MKRGGLFGVFFVALATSGCEAPGICDGKALALEISGNHEHGERIEKKVLAKGPGRYLIEGGTHEHGFRLSDADIAKLKRGESIELRSTSMNAHVHELRLKCQR